MTPQELESVRQQLRAAQKRMIAGAIDDYGQLKRELELKVAILIAAIEAGSVAPESVVLLWEYQALVSALRAGLDRLARRWSPQVSVLAANGAVAGETLLSEVAATSPALRPRMAPEGIETTPTLNTPEKGTPAPATVHQRLAIANSENVDRFERLLATNWGRPDAALTLRRATGEVVDASFARLYTTARTEHLLAFRRAFTPPPMAGPQKVRWVARCTSRTCAYCFAMHGQLFDANKPPSFHPNCLCVLVPDDAYSHDGVSGKQRFDALDRREQDRILGRPAGAAYRNGRVTLADFAGDGSQRSWRDVKQRRGIS